MEAARKSRIFAGIFTSLHRLFGLQNQRQCIVFHPSKSCSSVVDRDSIVSLREYCASLERDELDLVIKSSLYSQRKNGPQTDSVKHVRNERHRPSQNFFLKGREVCREVFCFAHGIGNKKFRNICQSLDLHGLVPRTHGNTHKRPHNALLFSDRDTIKQFILRYASENAVPLPGRLPNYRERKVLLLPSDKTKADIHDIFTKLADSMKFRQVSRTTFYRTWRDLCPNVVLSKPSTDLCHKCQTFSCKISNSGSVPEEEKAELLLAYQCHVEQAKMQRDDYREQCEKSKISCSTSPVHEGADPCSLSDVTVHYSWDFAQQVHLPHHSQQVGPIFFKTPRKCEVFGVCCEGSEKQVFYLADEGQAPGKGANTVLSYVHHFLENYGLGEDTAQFHFDNCCGQNKNNTVLWYALWRVITGLHLVVEYTMMVAGHTKFSPDWHFGLWKSRWRHVDAETIQDVAMCVQQSSRNGHNIPHMVDDDSRPVQFYDWKSFLQRFFKPLKYISKYHYFRVMATDPGIVVCKKFVNSPEEKFTLLRNTECVAIGGMPANIGRNGIDPERQWYLFEQIRQFCRSDSAKDEICPLPKVAKKKASYKKRKC